MPAEAIVQQLDPAQAEAVAAFGPRTVVAAGAGSGKTRVLTYGLAHLLSDQIAWQPQELMLLTFTRQAAEEMRERAQHICRRDLSDLRAGTFHAVAGRLLSDHGMGCDLLDESEAQLLIAELVSAAVQEDDLGHLELPTPDVCMSVISRAAEERRDIDDVLVEVSPRHLDTHRLLDRVAGQYADRKQQMGVRDFSDLLLDAEQFLDTDLGRQFVVSLRAVLVDEVQDLNAAQRRLVAALCAAGAWQVSMGDPNQSIYGFRGADVHDLYAYAAHPDTRVVKLQTNYRSSGEIVDYANALADHNLLTVRMRSARGLTSQPVSVLAPADCGEESELVRAWAVRHLAAGSAAEDLAVLARGHDALEPAARCLVDADMQVALLGRPRGHAEEVRQGLVALMRLAGDPHHEMAWQAMLKLWRVPQGERAELAAQIAQDPDPLVACEQLGGEPVGAVMEAIRGREPGRELWQDMLWGHYGQMAAHAEPDAQRRGRMMQRLLAACPQTTATGSAFLEAMMEGEDGSGGQPGVRLATGHASKGLEWAHVLLLGARPMRTPNAFAGWHPDHQEPEERRLFYVAVTRARDTLTILSAPGD